MDANDVITLASQAAASVLGFRTVAFGARPFIDVKIFKANLRISIRTLTKDKEHTADIPLSSVVEIVGKAAFSAAKKWNKVAAKNNLIDGDWFRNCVCDLVGGVVTKIGHQAHHQLTSDVLNLDEEFIDPHSPRDEMECSSAPAERRARRTQMDSHPPSAGLNASLDNGLMEYYGLGPAKPQPTPADDDAHDPLPLRPPHDVEALLPRHQLTEGWNSITKYAADPFSSTAAAECEATIATLAVVRSRKRAAPPSETSEDSDENNEELGGIDNDEQEAEHEDEQADSSIAGSVIHEPSAKRAHFDDSASDMSPVASRSSSVASSLPSPLLATASQSALKLGGGAGLGTPNVPPGVAALHAGVAALYVAPGRRLSPRSHSSVGVAVAARPEATGRPGVVGQARKTSIRMFWTKQEEDVLVKARRDENKNWDEVQALLKRHTRQACQKKYWDLEAKRKASTGEEGQKPMPRV